MDSSKWAHRSIEDLKHKLEAQTEAYVEFNNALVKILELQNQLKTDLLNNSNLEITEIRSIFEKVLIQRTKIIITFYIGISQSIIINKGIKFRVSDICEFGIQFQIDFIPKEFRIFIHNRVIH